MKKVIVIGGPTAVGKSELAIELAKKIDGEIINGDSMQVYKEMNIGTAKVSEKETQGIPHHLLGFISVKEDFSVADYQKLAREKIDEIIAKKKVPIIIGGTGLYLKSVIYDYDFKEEASIDMSEFDSFNNEELYDYLLKLDEDAAKKTHPNNRKRVLRAIEIYKANGETKTSLEKKQKHEPIYDCVFVGLTMPREELYERINKRVDKMISEGLVEEAKVVLETARKSSTALQAIGYKEFVPYFNKEKELEEVANDIKQNTRHYAKRQFTFFNNQFNVDWYNLKVQKLELVVDYIIDTYRKGK